MEIKKGIPSLTQEERLEWLELVKTMEAGKLYQVCTSCSNFYLISRENFGGPNMCKNCLNGVTIPTF